MMSHVKHELHEEFPEYDTQIHDLKVSSAHFRNLSEKYHDLNRDIHRAETDIEPTTDEHLNEMRRARLQLKDEILEMLKKDA